MMLSRFCIKGRKYLFNNNALKIHTSQTPNGTHNYEATRFSLPKDKLQEAFSNPKIFQQVSRDTGAVVRWENVGDDDVIQSSDENNQVLLVGHSRQVQKAMQLLLDSNKTTDQDQGKRDIKNTTANTKLIWHGYKRNFKGQFAPAKPRKKCIRCGGKMLSGNPCPLCQLQLNSGYTVHYTDIGILEQFICPYTWEVLNPTITGLCRQQHRLVEAAIYKSRNYGYLPFTLPIISNEPKKHKPAGVPTDRKIKVKMH